jgi:hypothetical protein
MAALLLAVWAISAGWPVYQFPYFAAGLALGWVPTLITYLLVTPALTSKIHYLLGRLLAGMMGKMLAGIVGIIAVALTANEQLAPFSIAFLISYFIFTGFEVYGLIRKLRPHSGKE